MPRTVLIDAIHSYSLSDSWRNRGAGCPDGGVSGILVSSYDRVAEEANDVMLPVPSTGEGNVAVSVKVV